MSTHETVPLLICSLHDFLTNHIWSGEDLERAFTGAPRHSTVDTTKSILLFDTPAHSPRLLSLHTKLDTNIAFLLCHDETLPNPFQAFSNNLRYSLSFQIGDSWDKPEWRFHKCFFCHRQSTVYMVYPNKKDIYKNMEHIKKIRIWKNKR